MLPIKKHIKKLAVLFAIPLTFPATAPAFVPALAAISIPSPAEITTLLEHHEDNDRESKSHKEDAAPTDTDSDKPKDKKESSEPKQKEAPASETDDTSDAEDNNTDPDATSSSQPSQPPQQEEPQQTPSSDTNNNTAPSQNTGQKSAPANTSGGFEAGMVTMRFDDGWASQYQYALPKLQEAGFKGVFYITTQQTGDNGYTGFMTRAQVKDMYAKGQEIGAHTRTHAHLTQLSPEQQREEIAGSKQDLESWGIGGVNSFAYPFGEYDQTTIDIVKSSGFSSAAATRVGFVEPNSNRYELKHYSVRIDSTVADIKAQIDQALAEKKWLILTFHRIDETGDEYSITPANFGEVVNYLKTKQAQVTTTSEGVARMH